MVNEIGEQQNKSNMEALAIQKVVAKLKKAPSYFDEILTELALNINPDYQKSKQSEDAQRQVILMEFLFACQSKAFKQWNIFKEEFGELCAAISKERIPTPERKGIRGTGKGEMDRIARFYDYRQVQYFPTLPLHKCKTIKEKIKLISESNAPAEIKVEFITDLVAQKNRL